MYCLFQFVPPLVVFKKNPLRYAGDPFPPATYPVFSLKNLTFDNITALYCCVQFVPPFVVLYKFPYEYTPFIPDSIIQPVLSLIKYGEINVPLILKLYNVNQFDPPFVVFKIFLPEETTYPVIKFKK